MIIEKKKGVKGNYNTYKDLRYLIKTINKKELKKNKPKNSSDNILEIEEELLSVTKTSIDEVREAISYAVKKGASNIKAYAKNVIENRWNKKDSIRTGFDNFTQRQYDYGGLEESLVYAHMRYTDNEKGRMALERYKSL